MKERPIIFSGPMVRLILDGRKTMTRRVVRLSAGEIAHEGGDGSLHAVANTTWGDCIERVIQCPYGVPGDMLWVRETCWHREVHHADCLDEYEYCATCEHPNGSTNPADYNTNDGYWRKLPSIFMPRWASRLTLRIMSVSVERVRTSRKQTLRRRVLFLYREPKEIAILTGGRSACCGTPSTPRADSAGTRIRGSGSSGLSGCHNDFPLEAG